MDLTNYVSDKEKGLIAAGKVGNAYFVSKRQFSPATGEELAPLVEAIDLAKIDQQIASLEGQVELLKVFRADLVALDHPQG